MQRKCTCSHTSAGGCTHTHKNTQKQNHTTQTPPPTPPSLSSTHPPPLPTHLELVGTAVEIQGVVVVCGKHTRGMLHRKPCQCTRRPRLPLVIGPHNGTHVGFVWQERVVSMCLLLHDLVVHIDEGWRGCKGGMGVVPTHTPAVMGRGLHVLTAVVVFDVHMYEKYQCMQTLHKSACITKHVWCTT